tara:strand:+ start:7451 stop:8068 length:618 start_codon:yes stop_codon:yes gene_type:complete
MSFNIIFSYKILNDSKDEINEDLLNEAIDGVFSKTELRKRFASMSYDIMNDKDIKHEKKIGLIQQLYKLLEENEKNIEDKAAQDEQEEAEDLHGKIEHFITIELGDKPNQKGFYLKNIYTDVKSLNYPITSIDQVNGFLTDIEKLNTLFFEQDPEVKKEIKDSMDGNIIRHQISKIIPNETVGGKKTKKRKNRKNRKNKSKKLQK